jgi:hypothetical protein
MPPFATIQAVIAGCRLKPAERIAERERVWILFIKRSCCEYFPPRKLESAPRPWDNSKNLRILARLGFVNMV